MPPSQISDPPSSPDESSQDAADHNLQPFFVLHKASSSRNPSTKASRSGKARRKIDLPSPSPKPAEKSDDSRADPPENEAYERLRLEAFDCTWSKIESTIKDVLMRINLNLFDDVKRWVIDSFSTVRSSGEVSKSEVLRPYPLVTDNICKQIPTALISTRNVEFVDDLLTFQELGRHLRSNGCHVANLSALDFSTKHGIGGCLRALLRQLIPDASDVADVSVLASWYCESANYDSPVVVIIDDMERCDSSILAEFITLLSEWVIKVPVIFIMGVTTTVDAARKLLPSDALQHLQACKFTLGSPSERMSAIVEAVLVNFCSGFSIGHEVALFLRNYFLRHDGTITSFIKAIKLACTKHFIMEPLSFLGVDIEDCEAFWKRKCKALPKDLYISAFHFPSYESFVSREKLHGGIDGNLAQGLSELRRLQKVWSSVVMCLFEVGKFNKMQLLDIFCEAVDSASCSLHVSSANQNLIEGRFSYAIGGLIAQAMQKVRELQVPSLCHLLSAWGIHTKEMTEIHEEVRDLKSALEFSVKGKIVKEICTDIHRRSVSSNARIGTSSVNDKAAMLLERMVRKYLVPVECIPFHEIFCFKKVDILQSAMIGDPRRTVQVDLLKSHTHLQCSCCGGEENALSPSMHDTSIMYNLAQEYGDLINLHDWYHSFKLTILSSRFSAKTKRKIQQSPASKKMKATPLESEAMIQARFCRAVVELQITGLLRMPNKRRPDFVQRVAFGL